MLRSNEKGDRSQSLKLRETTPPTPQKKKEKSVMNIMKTHDEIYSISKNPF